MTPIRDLLEREEYLADLSILQLLPHFVAEETFTLLVPRTLDMLLTAPPSLARDAVIERVIGLGKRPTQREDALYGISEGITVAYKEMKSQGSIRVIPDLEAGPEMRQALAGIVRNNSAEPSLELPDITLTKAAVVQRHLITILEHSRRTGTAILMRGRGLVSRLAGRLAILELPAKADRLTKIKQRRFAGVFDFKGGKAIRLFIGIVSSFASQDPILGTVGIVLTFIDP